MILETISVESVRKDAIILDTAIVEPYNVEPVSVDTVMVLLFIVEYSVIGAVICDVSARVLPVRVDKLTLAAFMAAKLDVRMVK